MKGHAIVSIMLLGAVFGAARAGEVFDSAALDFAARLDLREAGLLAVQDAGRTKILETLAAEQVREFYGDERIDAAGPVFSFLEVYFNTGAYMDKPVIRVKSRTLRDRLLGGLPLEAAAAVNRTGRIAPLYLLDGASAGVLMRGGRVKPAELDLQRAGRLVGPLRDILQSGLPEHSAAQRLLGRMRAFAAAGTFRVVPISAADPTWLAPEEVAALADGAQVDGFPQQTAAAIAPTFDQLAAAWRARDADQTNKLLASLCQEMAGRGGAGYPGAARRRLEHQYNRFSGFTIAWIGFAAATVLLLASLPGRRRPLKIAGMVVFVLATLLLAAGFAIRWVLSGRGWLPPLTNQYESVVAVALLAALTGLVLEAITRRGVLALAASVIAAIALLTAFLQPGPVSADINAPMGILNSSILAWHVATLIMGYAMIGMSVVISLAYFAVRAVRAARGAAAGEESPSSSPDLTARPAGLLAELDRFNLILIQLACWMVTVGVVLGAYWADVAWGRWWGWDPKETWGLMTMLIYVGIVHIRFATPARTRGAWTAGLSIVGCAVMAFTWWGVNYAFRGLHSYG